MHPFINILGYTFQSYWVMVYSGVISGIIISSFETKRKNESILKVLCISVLIVLIGLFFAHLSSYLFWSPSYIIKNPLKLLRFWAGGLTLHGGLVGGILAGLILSQIAKIPFWKLADIYAPALPLAQFFGRIGCFLNGCCYGYKTEVPWGITFTNPDSISPTMVKLHPTQLYEAGGSIIIFIIIWRVRKNIKYKGGVFLHYLILYSILRSIVSSYRADSHYLWGTNIKTIYIVCVLTIAIALTLKSYLKKKNNKLEY